MRRSLRGLEKTMVQLGPVMGPDVVVGIVDGELPVGVLRRAVELLQHQYATLRTRLEGEELVVGGPVPVSLDVVDGDWRLWAELELSRPLRLEVGEAMRVVFVPGAGAVLLSVHHALVDGASLLALLRDLLGHCGAVLEGRFERAECVPLAPAVLDAMPGAFWQGPVGAVAAAAAPVFVGLEQRRLLGQGVKLGPISSCAVFGEGSPEGLQRLVAACKAHGVTVGAAAMAAGSFALGLLREQRTGGLRPVDVEVEVDLRRRSDPVLPADRVGFHTGGVRVEASDLDFWSLARQLGGRVQRQIELGVPRLSHVVADSLTWAPQQAPGAWVAISNLGRFTHATRYGSLELNAVYGMNGAVPGGPAVIFWLRTVKGRFCFNAIGSQPTVTPAELQAVSTIFLDLLENCSANRLSGYATTHPWPRSRIPCTLPTLRSAL